MIDPAIGTLLAAAFALLFASAAFHKVRDLAVFAAVVRAYRILPAGLELSWVLPVLELGVAIGLLLPLGRNRAAPLGAVLLVVYALAMAVNLQRGRRELSCGCGAPQERRPIARWMVLRNLLFAAVLGSLALPWSPRPLQPVDFLTVGMGLAVATLLYMSTDRLLGRLAPRVALWEGIQ